MLWPSLLVVVGVALVALRPAPAAGQQQPGLGQSPQYFYLAPSAAAALPPPPPQLQLAQLRRRTEAPSPPRMLPPAAVAQAEAEAEAEAAEAGAEAGAELGQFHAADGRGRAVFGYLLPDQTRVEQRGPDGSVRGAYSYLDTDGRAVKVQYWDAGAGFHTASNHLPALALGLPQPVRDTAEVQAARDQHLQQVQAALLQHAQALQLLQQQQQVSAVAADSDSLVVESDGHQEPAAATAADDGELTRYPDLQQVAQPLYDPSHVHDPGREAVIVDAEAGAGAGPRSRGRGRARVRGKALPLPLSDGPAAGPQQRLRAEPPHKSPGSFYMFWHSVPVYVEVKPVADGGAGGKSQAAGAQQPLSVSQKAAFAQAQLPAAVHSFQTAPVHPLQPLPARPQLPLYLSPHPHPPAAAPAPASLGYSAKAHYFQSIPVAAVHDAQVHPNQLGSVPNHQLLPVFHQAPLEGQ